MAGDIIFKKLEAAALDQVSRFRMAAESDAALQIFLRRFAKKSADASLTKTYVAKQAGTPQVIGYITIMCAQVALAKTYDIPDKAGADGWDYHPAVRIARLGVADDHRATGLGKKLVELALGMIAGYIEPHVGCRFVIVDAKLQSVGFYERLGFRLLDTAGNRASETPLMFLDLKAHVAR